MSCAQTMKQGTINPYVVASEQFQFVATSALLLFFQYKAHFSATLEHVLHESQCWLSHHVLHAQFSHGLAVASISSLCPSPSPWETEHLPLICIRCRAFGPRSLTWLSVGLLTTALPVRPTPELRRAPGSLCFTFLVVTKVKRISFWVSQQTLTLHSIWSQSKIWLQNAAGGVKQPCSPAAQHHCSHKFQCPGENLSPWGLPEEWGWHRVVLL